MKSDVMGIGAPINKKDLKELLKETKKRLLLMQRPKETIAVHLAW